MLRFLPPNNNNNCKSMKHGIKWRKKATKSNNKDLQMFQLLDTEYSAKVFSKLLKRKASSRQNVQRLTIAAITPPPTKVH